MSEMGTPEMGAATTKTTKTSGNPHEQQQQQQQHQPSSTSATAINPMTYLEWAAAMQAYYGSVVPSGYFSSTAGSGPQPHPFMWAVQPLMPPYGTPYAAVYAHGGIYAHPSMSHGAHPYSPYAISPGSSHDAHEFVDTDSLSHREVRGNCLQNAVSGCSDGEKKSEEGGKGAKGAMKKSTGSLGSLEMGSAKGNGNTTGGKERKTALSHSHDTSGSDGSTDGSDENSRYVSEVVCNRKSEHVSTEVENLTKSYSSGNDMDQEETFPVCLTSMSGKQGVGAGPRTNLNIGMDYWNGGTPSVLVNGRGHRAPSSTPVIPGVSGNRWPQDERELKKQRRKQSNRDSARRSRLRKQAECEDLASRVETLVDENTALRDKLARVTEQCNRLSANNTTLLKQMQSRRGIHHAQG